MPASLAAWLFGFALIVAVVAAVWRVWAFRDQSGAVDRPPASASPGPASDGPGPVHGRESSRRP